MCVFEAELFPVNFSSAASGIECSGMHGESCLYEPIQLLSCLIVTGCLALISGFTVCSVGDHASPFFLHPNITVSFGQIIILDGLKVRLHSLARLKTSFKFSNRSEYEFVAKS